MEEMKKNIKNKNSLNVSCLNTTTPNLWRKYIESRVFCLFTNNLENLHQHINFATLLEKNICFRNIILILTIWVL